MNSLGQPYGEAYVERNGGALLPYLKLKNSAKVIYFFHCEFHGSNCSKGSPDSSSIGVSNYWPTVLLKPLYYLNICESKEKCRGLPFTEMQNLRREKNSASFKENFLNKFLNNKKVNHD